MFKKILFIIIIGIFTQTTFAINQDVINIELFKPLSKKDLSIIENNTFKYNLDDNYYLDGNYFNNYFLNPNYSKDKINLLRILLDYKTQAGENDKREFRKDLINKFIDNCQLFGEKYYPDSKYNSNLGCIYQIKTTKSILSEQGKNDLEKILEKERNFYYNIKFKEKYGKKYSKNKNFRECIKNETKNRNIDSLKAVDYCKDEAKTTIKLVFGGDIMLSRSIGYWNKTDGYDRLFRKYHPNENLSSDTLLFYNLESPFSINDKDNLERSFIFAANTKNIKVLNQLSNNQENKMMLSLANNHIQNALGEGIETTIDTLTENGISYVGAGKEGEDTHNVKFLTDDNGNKVCFQAYTYDGGMKFLRDKNNLVKKYPINSNSINNIKKDIRKMVEANCDMKIISIHWGAEYRKMPNNMQKNLGHHIIDAGADLIIGSHSHIFGEVEEYKGKKIYYSMGNFIFDQDWGKTSCEELSQDCEYDEKLKRKVLKTYIGTSIYSEYEVNFEGKVKLKKEKMTNFEIEKGILKPLNE